MSRVTFPASEIKNTLAGAHRELATAALDYLAKLRPPADGERVMIEAHSDIGLKVGGGSVSIIVSVRAYYEALPDE